MQDEDLCFEDLLDATFQAVLCGVLVHNEQFLARARGIILPSYFGAAVYKAVCQGIFNHWDEYGRVPVITELKIEVSKLTAERDTRDAWMRVVEQLYNMPEEEREPVFVARELVNFAQRAQASSAVRDAWNAVKQFDIADLHRQLDGILKLRAIFEDLGYDLRKDYPEAYKEDPRMIFRTGFAEFDKAMRHGMREGELVSIVAPSKRGKSLILYNIAAGLMYMGFDVVLYTLEMQRLDVLKRLVSILCDKPTNELEHHVTTVRDCMEMLEKVTDKTIIVKEFPARAIKFEAVEAHYNLVKLRGDRIVPILDYADLVKGPREKDSEWMEVYEIYMQFRNMGREYGVPAITASQTNAGGMEAENIEQWHMAGSTRKGFTADYVWGLNQSKTDYKLGRYKLMPFLNRHARKDFVVWGQTDYTTGKVREIEETAWRGLAAGMVQEDPLAGDPIIGTDPDRDPEPSCGRGFPSPLQS